MDWNLDARQTAAADATADASPRALQIDVDAVVDRLGGTVITSHIQYMNCAEMFWGANAKEF